ncbi:hypothetical protein SORBI_3004G286450 [Sorghum bicolor]|uniref:Uncharacterized protein n=1 Tax=Sorghum bicolor TaxID=4558 RepID=A0A1Z5RPH2_SORBI|nr:hypothetical protein SORBI_3004G286450 [Sorghum bicolor]
MNPSRETLFVQQNRQSIFETVHKLHECLFLFFVLFCFVLFFCRSGGRGILRDAGLALLVCTLDKMTAAGKL